MVEKIDFKKQCDSLKDFGFEFNSKIESFSFANPADLLERSFKYFCGSYKKIKEYDEVVKWMENTNHKGLFLYGNVGRGKTVIACKVLPVLFSHFHNRILTMAEGKFLNENVEEVFRQKLVVIDDIGLESIRVNYGEKKMVFSEVVDQAEKTGKLLIVTTNLTLEELTAKYGERTIDRLKAITTRVLFKGKSMRR